MNELEVLQTVCSRLEGAGFDYMLTGSLAMNYYAQPRMTRDIDLVVALSPADRQVLLALFSPDFYVDEDSVARALEQASIFNLVHLDSVVKVDVIIRKDSLYRQTEFKRRQRIDLGGFPLWIVSKEDLILSKLEWAKPTKSELQLRDVRNLLASGADLDYLRNWADRLSTRSLLEDCLAN